MVTREISIAFPAIAVGAVADFLAADDRLRRVIFCCFGAESLKAYEKALAARQKSPPK